MLKYVDFHIAMQEVPDQVTLAINLSNCPCHCKGCHSSHLAMDIGNPLTLSTLNNMIQGNPGITCVAFMGGDAEPEAVSDLAGWIKFNHKNLFVAWYSGRQEISGKIEMEHFDFIKVGPYQKDDGPLNKPTTNQRFYQVEHDTKSLKDITNLFWKR